MLRIRRLRASFELACNNVPILEYQLCLIYILRGYFPSTLQATNNDRLYSSYVYKFISARLFQDFYEFDANKTLCEPGYIIYGQQYNEPRILMFRDKYRYFTYPLGTHIHVCRQRKKR